MEADKERGHASLSPSRDRVVTELGMMECLTDEDLSFKYRTKRSKQRVKIFKTRAKPLT